MKTALNYTTAQIIVGIFLFITLVVGLWAGRNVKTMKDYALANRQFGAMVLTIAFMAILIDGHNTQTLPSRIFSVGLVEIISRPGMAVSFLLFSWLVAPKVLRFKGCLILGEIAELLFGWNARVLVGFFGFLGTALWTSIQFLVLGTIGTSLLGVDERWVVLLGGGILTIYASVGGVRAVTMTDIIQFIALVLCITLMTGAVVYHAGGIKVIWEKVSASHPERLLVVEHPRFTLKSLYFLDNAAVVTTFFFPSFFQRILMGRNTKEIRKMLVSSAVIWGLFIGAIILIALGGLALYPDSAPNEIMMTLSKSLFSKSIQGIFAVGFIAIVMSTVDSSLSPSGLVLTHDVLKPVSDRFQIKINELRIVKWVTLLSGLAALFIAVGIKEGTLLEVIPNLVGYSNEAISVFAVPMCIGIMGLITDRRSFVAGVSVAVLMLVAMHVLDLTGVTRELIVLGSMVANAVAFLITHYIINDGFKYTEVIDMGPGNPPLVKPSTWHPSLYQFTLWFDQHVPTPQNILQYSKNKVKSYGHYRKPLVGYYLSMLLIWATTICLQLATMSPLSLLLRIGGLFPLLVIFLGGAFQWKTRRYFPLFWHLTLMYCLPFMLMFMYLWEGGGTLLSIELLVGMVLLMRLVDRTSFWILKLTGALLACGVYYLVKGVNPLILTTESLWILSGYGAAMMVVRSSLQPILKIISKAQRESQYRKDMEEIMYSGISWGEEYRGEQLERVLDIVPYMQKVLQDKVVNTERKHVFVVTLDSATKIINIKMLHMGTKDQTICMSKDVLNEALVRDASGVIIIHNHPNEDPRPSKEDEKSTTDLLYACHSVGLMLLDHLIMTTSGRYFSFRGAGHIPKIEGELETHIDNRRHRKSKKS